MINISDINIYLLHSTNRKNDIAHNNFLCFAYIPYSTASEGIVRFHVLKSTYWFYKEGEHQSSLALVYKLRIGV